MTGALTTLQQWLLFSGTIVAIGTVTWRIAVAPGAARTLPPDDASELAAITGRVRAVGITSVLVLLVAWGLRMVVQVMGFRDPFVPLWDDVSFLLFELFWGTVWMTQGAVLLCLLLSLWFASRTPTISGNAGIGSIGPGWLASALLIVALAATLALSGHAMGADSFRGLAVTADALHTLAAGLWIGTLAVVLLAGRTGANAGGARVFAAQLEHFSPLAQVGVGTLVAMGAFLSWTHLPAPSDLWTSTYGRLLSAKIAGAVLIMMLGFWNWKRGLPMCDTAEGVATVRRRATFEVCLAVGVVLLTAILVHSPKP